MNTDTEYLKSIAQAISFKPSLPKTEIPDHLLASEARRLEQAIFTQLAFGGQSGKGNNQIIRTLTKLTDICDALYNSSISVTADVLVVMDLLNCIRSITPEQIRPNIKLPKAFLALNREDWLEIWTRHSGVMREQGIAEKLVEIAGIPFRRFTDGKPTLYWGDYTWLKGYHAKLEIIDWQEADCNSPEETLLSLLIGSDFNDDRFYRYCRKYIQTRTDKINGKYQKLLEYAKCQKLVLQDTQTGVSSFDGRANTVSARLIKWIGEEIEFVERYERERPQSKFEFKWNVETIAFFFKLLWDHKVFGKVSLEPLSEQIAANCSSVGKDEFQATTIFSRFYVKDVEVLKRIENVLAEMLEDVRRFG